jgi:hypothetical protein
MVKRLGVVKLVGLVCAVGIPLVPATAWAQDGAVVGVGGFAEPPPRPRDTQAPVAADPPEPREEPAHAPEPYRSVLRIAPGLGVSADFGTGTVGFRLAAAWLRGEPSGGVDAVPSPIAGGLAQYTGELTLDLRKRGPLHPVLGIGFGLAEINGEGKLGIGTGRLGLEYALTVDDADVRIGGGVTGILPGPADTSVQDVRGWVVAGLALGVGF